LPGQRPGATAKKEEESSSWASPPPKYPPLKNSLSLSAQFATAVAALASASPQSDGEDGGFQQRYEKKMRRHRKAFASLQLEQLKRRLKWNQYPVKKQPRSGFLLNVFQV